MRRWEFTTTSTRTSVLTFRCTTCGYEDQAIVVGVGVASAETSLGIGMTDAQAAADEGAAYAASASARRAVRLVRCPRCGERDRSAVVAQWLEMLGRAGLVLAVAGFLGLLAGKLVLALLVGAVVSLVAYVVLWRREWNVDGRVAFVREKPLRFSHRKR